MEPRITVITLGVEDLDRSVRFYRDGLGLPLKDGKAEGIAFFPLRDTWLALYPRRALADDAGVPAEGGGYRGVTLSHNVRERTEVAEVLSAAVAAGAKLVKRAQDTFWGGHAGYFADPDGHLWEVAWNPKWPVDP